MASAPTLPRRDRPTLLPSNRKLRNLLSISLRNLTLDPASPSRRRNRGKTIDDDAVPQALRSPAKLVALRERRETALEHSRSSEDLRAAGAVREDGGGSPSGKTRPRGSSGVLVEGEGGSGHNNVNTPRLDLKKLRRRSTLEWANATPQRRQERLEGVTADRMADVFFSLHVRGFEEPIYVSEMVERTMNPTFRHVDFSACGPGVTRLEHVTLRVWIRSAKAKGWRQLLELEVGLRGLMFLGKSLESLPYPLPPNTTLFHLTDGIYIPFTSLSDYIPPPPAPARTTSTRTLPTSSFDALLRLAKLDDSIQDALATRDALATSLETLLQTHKAALNARDTVAEAEDRLQTIAYAQKTVQKQLEKARTQAAEKRASLALRREIMSADLEQRKQLRSSRQPDDEGPDKSQPPILHKAVAAQRHRILLDLQTIYPIQPIAGQSLAFTIRGLHIPDSGDLDSAENVDNLAAALGYAAHAVLLLSFYLGKSVPYPVEPRGSGSGIWDTISLLTSTSTSKKKAVGAVAEKERRYPLFSRGVPRFRFEYAVFLLNKDVQILLESVYGVRVLDVRQTLGNLKYLLYVATAGRGEVPGRKVGLVRAMAKGRRGSRGSRASVGSETLVGSANGDLKEGRGAVESLRRNMGSALEGGR